jgi:hypothetical protein
MRRTAAGLAVFLAIVIAHPAAAFKAGRVFTAPALAGGRIVWSERPGGGTLAVVRSATTGGARRLKLLSIPSAVNFFDIYAGPGVAASPVRVGASINAGYPGFRNEGGSTSMAAWTGRSDTPLSKASGYCDGGDVLAYYRTVDVSGSAVAYADCEHGGVTVRDYSSAVPPRNFPIARELRLAGRYLALLERPSNSKLAVGVYDTTTGVRVYRVRSEDLDGPDPSVSDFDVAEDGSVAITYATTGETYGGPGWRVAWAARESPLPTRVPLPDAARYHVRMARPGVIVYARSRSNSPWRTTELGVTDPRGHRRTLVRGAYDGYTEVGFDVDASRIAWFDAGCRGARLHVTRIDAPSVTATPARGCPLRFGAQTELRGPRRLHVFPDCYGFTFAPFCIERATLRIRGLGRYRGVLIAKGGAWNGARLTHAGRHILRHERSIQTRASATLSDGEQPFRDRRSGRLRLRLCPEDEASARKWWVDPSC